MVALVMIPSFASSSPTSAVEAPLGIVTCTDGPSAPGGLTWCSTQSTAEPAATRNAKATASRTKGQRRPLSRYSYG